METTVVNIRSDDYDVYIGRPSKWGNPFQIGRDGTREQVINAYQHWFLSESPELIEAAKRELPGKVLGCFCKPDACHGDVLASIVNDSLAQSVEASDSKPD